MTDATTTWRRRTPTAHAPSAPVVPAARGLGPAQVALAAVLLAHAVISAVQVLVLNPLAAIPGRGLAEIYAGVTASGESMSVPTVFAALALPLVLGAAVLAQTARSSLSRTTSTGLLLGLVAFSAVTYWFASGGPAMALADAYLISGAPYSPWWMVPAGLSLAALATLAIRARRDASR